MNKTYDNTLMENLALWALAVGNWRFLYTLEQYEKIASKTDFKAVLEQRKKQRSD